MSPRRTTSEPPARLQREIGRAGESEIARTVTAEYTTSPTSTGELTTMETTQATPAPSPSLSGSAFAAPAAVPFPHHHNGDSENVARLLADILSRLRSDPAFRPPPLGPKALLAIAQYQVASAALNPGPAPVIVDPIT